MFYTYCKDIHYLRDKYDSSHNNSKFDNSSLSFITSVGYGILPPIETQNTSNDSLYLVQSNPHPYSVALQVVQEDKKRSLPPPHSCLLHIAS